MFEELYGFDQEQVLPRSKSNSGRRSQRIQSNMNTYFENQRLENSLKESDDAIKEQMMFEERAKGFSNSSMSQRRRMLAEEVNLEKKLMKTAVVNFLTETAMSGLVFDQSFLDSNGTVIKSKVKDLFNECYDKGLINDNLFIKCKSIPIQEAYNEMRDYVKIMIDHKDDFNIFNEDAVIEILNEAPRAKNLSKDIADKVKGKVEDTLEKEKKISKKKEVESDEPTDDTDEAADSLDTDVDEETGDDTDGEDDDTDDTEGDDDMDSEDDDDTDGSIDDTEDDDDMDGEDDTEESDVDDSADSESPQDDTSNGEDTGTSTAEADMANGLKIVVQTNGSQVTVSANKSESMEYFNIIGRRDFKERNSKSIFRNLLEANVVTSYNMLQDYPILNEDNSIMHKVDANHALNEGFGSFIAKVKEKRAKDRAYNEKYRAWQKKAKEENKIFFPALSNQEIDVYYNIGTNPKTGRYGDGSKNSKELITAIDAIRENVNNKRYIDEQLPIMRYMLSKYNGIYKKAKSVVNESSSPYAINMDMVLGETVIQYTLLETMYTSKLFDMSSSDVYKFQKALNFNRK
jgi:hypothetical protein